MPSTCRTPARGEQILGLDEITVTLPRQGKIIETILDAF
jgi:hypothetical protein